MLERLTRNISGLPEDCVRFGNGKDIEIDVSVDRVKDYLGIEKFRLHSKEEESEVGVSTGLAWTQVGGDILQIEGYQPEKVTHHHRLGDVCRVRPGGDELCSPLKCMGIEADFYQRVDIHIHVQGSHAQRWSVGGHHYVHCPRIRSDSDSRS